MSDDVIEDSLSHELSKRRFPFGNPDGSKADLGTSQNKFVRLDERQFTSGISAQDTDRSIRIIVGKKGAGKTIYLRRLQDSVRRENSVSSGSDLGPRNPDAAFASKISKDIPSTELVMGFCQLFDPELVTEAWQTAWRIAILRSVVSYLKHKRFFRVYIDQKILSEKIMNLQESERGGITERSPYTELKDIIADYKTSSQYFRFSGSSKWDELQTILGTALKDCPPIFLYMDASDDEFGHAPMDWHRCQKGLFYAVTRLLDQSGAIGSRLHIVIAVRDIVYSSVMQSEHRTRYINSPSICLLDWDYHSIKYFIEQKLKSVGEEYFEDATSKTLPEFLSTKTIFNNSRGIEEDIFDYVIRHTRALPRDIIQVGNLLAREKLQSKARGESLAQWLERIKENIASMSRIFAEEQLTTCAHQLASHDAPAHSVRHKYADIYTSNKEYINYRLDTIKKYFRYLGDERLTYDQLIKADKKFSAEVASGVPISTILWQNGLIAIRKSTGNRFRFYSSSESSEFKLPDHGSEYAVHSIVRDLIPNLKLSFEKPVIDRS